MREASQDLNQVTLFFFTSKVAMINESLISNYYLHYCYSFHLPGDHAAAAASAVPITTSSVNVSTPLTLGSCRTLAALACTPLKGKRKLGIS